MLTSAPKASLGNLDWLPLQIILNILSLLAYLCALNSNSQQGLKLLATNNLVLLFPNLGNNTT